MILRVLECDYCGVPWGREPLQELHVKEMRAMAAEDGWHRSFGFDLCPIDWKIGWRGHRDRRELVMVSE